MAKPVSLNKQHVFVGLNLIGLTANFANGCVPHTSPLAYCLRGVSFGCGLVSASMALNAGDKKAETISAIGMFIESVPLMCGLPGGLCWPNAVVQSANIARGLKQNN